MIFFRRHDDEKKLRFEKSNYNFWLIIISHFDHVFHFDHSKSQVDKYDDSDSEINHLTYLLCDVSRR
jgi:hypothetical protein